MGRYLVRVLSQRFKQAKTGTWQFELYVQPLTYHGYNGEEDVSHGSGRTLRWFLTEKAGEYAIRDLRGLGWEGDSFAELEPTHPGCHSFVDMELECYMKIEARKDGSGSDERWNLHRDIVAEPLPESDLAKLHRMFAKELKSSKPKAPAKSPARKEAEAVYAGQPESKDIPF